MKSYISIVLSKCWMQQHKFWDYFNASNDKKLNSKITNQITFENPNESKDSKRKTKRLEKQSKT